MDKKTIVSKVIDKIEIKKHFNFIDKNKNEPVLLVRYFGKEFKDTHQPEGIKEIFKAIEDQGYINSNNLSVWKKIYDNLGIIYPVNVKE